LAAHKLGIPRDVPQAAFVFTQAVMWGLCVVFSLYIVAFEILGLGWKKLYRQAKEDIALRERRQKADEWWASKQAGKGF
jgi:hypothetical protein